MNKQIIIHQVNCMGVMGAGFARYVRDTYPQCYQSYREFCLAVKDNPQSLLGKIYIYEGIEDIIINMFSQCYYGRQQRYTDYAAMELALQEVRQLYPDDTIIAPYMIGCGLAGGDWSIVSQLLKKYNIQTSQKIQLKGDKKYE